MDVRKWLIENYRGLALVALGTCAAWFWVDIIPEAWLYPIIDWWENLTGGDLICIGDEG